MTAPSPLALPPREQGMILINVLLFVAIAAGMVMLMLSAEDVGLERAVMMRDADQAQAIAYGGEASAVTALRRDALTAPDVDEPGEEWHRLAERGTAIAGGRFELAIADAQGKFNLNSLMSGEVEPVEILDRITATLGIKPELAVALTEYIRLNGPLADLGPLAAAGLSAETQARLARLVTALPEEIPVNVNSASEPLLALILGDEAETHVLVERRTQNGFLTPEDLSVLTVAPEEVLSASSRYFWVRTRVTIGDTRQQLLSLVGRRIEPGKQPVVAVVGRWWGPGGPPEAPHLPSPPPLKP